ncbi:MAG TPA: penicillin-binding protein 2 [Candidatus Bipolaricaulota bacterium]|nr:penicillin-binding protein 2 [Candidatus Bipolaricaulota bacterium]
MRKIFNAGNNKKNRNDGQKNDRRILILKYFFIVFALLISIRLFKIQVLDHQYYYALASDQHEIFKQLYPTRGDILIREDTTGVFDKMEYYPLATNKDLTLVFAKPYEIEDPQAVLGGLKEVFHIDDEALEADLLSKLGKDNDPYEPVWHRAEDETVAKLKEMNLPGIYFAAEKTRYYPEKNIGSHVLGFVSHSDMTGNYGLEGGYNDVLAGKSGFLQSELDSLGRWISVAGKKFEQAEDGADIVLTIDKSIEFFACDVLDRAVEEYSAKSGSLIVMDPYTGRIIAMCGAPDFDPNNYNKVEDIDIFNNGAVSIGYEPGSIFKPITMAAAIDAGRIDPYTTYDDPGEERIDDFTIKNSDGLAHGIKNMTNVLEESLNTGAIFAARQIGLGVFRNYMENFGFGSPTGMELGPESSGDISSLKKSGEIYMATASFGQGIMTTPIQLIAAYAALVNGGSLVKPYIIDEIKYSDGSNKVTEPKVVRKVISDRTSALLKGMLVSVVKNGHAEVAGVPGYIVGGKTGTAQVADKVSGGYGEETIHSFAGFAPLENPRFVMIVKIDRPQRAYAVSTAAPTFGKISKFILEYYGVPPTE